MMNIHIYLMKFLILISLFFGVACSCLYAGEKPNILIVFSDQQNTLTLGCYGNEHMNTPNIDKLADEGMRFDNSISPWPMCTPYRAMLMTGKYPFKSGVATNTVAPKEGIPMMGEIFKNAGYLVGLTGKWHLWFGGHVNIPEEYRGGFVDYWNEVYPKEYQLDGKFDKKKLPKERIEEFGEHYFADVHTDNAIDFFKRAKAEDKPFLLVVAWNPPHPPYEAPKKFLEAKSTENIPVPKTVKNPSPNFPGGAKSTSVAKGLEDIFDDDKILIDKVLRPYFASCEALDFEFGRMMQSLKDLGMEENTIVIYTSDHGEQGGAHQLTQKFKPFEESIKVPFIIKYPKSIQSKSTTDRLMTPMDIIPTLLSLAGVKYDENDYDGKSMLKTLKSEDDSNAPDAVLIMSVDSCWRGVRTKQYTYAERLDKAWVLYDNLKDPLQEVNLVGNPEYAKILKDLKSQMKTLLIEAQDPYADFPANIRKLQEATVLSYKDSYLKFKKNYPKTNSPIHAIYKKFDGDNIQEN